MGRECNVIIQSADTSAAMLLSTSLGAYHVSSHIINHVIININITSHVIHHVNVHIAYVATIYHVYFRH
jgi:hypothetical protein